MFLWTVNHPEWRPGTTLMHERTFCHIHTNKFYYLHLCLLNYHAKTIPQNCTCTTLTLNKGCAHRCPLSITTDDLVGVFLTRYKPQDRCLKSTTGNYPLKRRSHHRASGIRHQERLLSETCFFQRPSQQCLRLCWALTNKSPNLHRPWNDTE